MGRRVHIVTHRQPIKLRIIGLYGQVELGPVEIRATVNASGVASLSHRPVGHGGVEGAGECLGL